MSLTISLVKVENLKFASFPFRESRRGDYGSIVRPSAFTRGASNLSVNDPSDWRDSELDAERTAHAGAALVRMKKKRSGEKKIGAKERF